MISAIICAAGKGERTGFSQNKVLQELNGLPVICCSLNAFSMSEINEIIVVCRSDEQERFQALLSPYPKAKLCVGGETRGESVYRGLLAAKGDIVLVHDGARPYLSREIILNCIQSIQEYGSGVCALPLSDTVVQTQDGNIIGVPERKSLYSVQTPQGFNKEKLLSAYEQARLENKTFTDESGVYAEYVQPPHIFLGERTNKKLTYAEDFAPCERVGFGVDTHAFGKEQDYITLAGAKIPSKSGLIAHSDGDVLIHALMDALLSAAGLRDIGYYFPDTDEAYAGADSMKLLERTLDLIKEKKLTPYNVSISILAEKPRLSPYIEEMKQSLSKALEIPLAQIGIAAGTNEKLGYVGQGLGITVYATVLLKNTH